MEFWQAQINEVIRDLIQKHGLYDNAIRLEENKTRTGDRTTSCTVFLYEKEYPETGYETDGADRSRIVVNIKASGTKERNRLQLYNIDKEALETIALPDGAVLRASRKPGKKDLEENPSLNPDEECVPIKNPYVMIDANADGLREYFRDIIEYALAHYESRASAFGCCALFEACSDAGKCLHVNPLYARACGYRKNLEAGNIFYGKRRKPENGAV